MESKRSYDLALAGIQNRNADETATGLIGMVAKLTHAEGVTLAELQEAEEQLIPTIKQKFEVVYDLSIAHSFPVRRLRSNPEDPGLLWVYMSPSFHGEGIPNLLASNGTIFAAISPEPSFGEPLRARFSNIGVENWQMIRNKEAASRRRRLAGKGEAYYHNRPGDSAVIPTHRQSYVIEPSQVGVHLEISTLRNPILGLPESYQSGLGEWGEEYPIPVDQLEAPVVTVASNRDMDRVFEQAGLYQPGIRAWNYASLPRRVRGVVLLAPSLVSSQTTRLGR